MYKEFKNGLRVMLHCGHYKSTLFAADATVHAMPQRPNPKRLVRPR